MKNLFTILLLIPSLSWGGKEISHFVPSAWLCTPDGLTGLNWSEKKNKWVVKEFQNQNFILSIFEDLKKCPGAKVFGGLNTICTSFKWNDGGQEEFPVDGYFYETGEGARSWVTIDGSEDIILNDEGDFSITFAIPLTLMEPLSEKTSGSIYVGAGKCQKIL